MLDKKHLVIKAGDGGDGRVLFRREKYVPKGGPAGGDGGDGGSVIIRANKQLTTFKHLAGRHKFEAERGQDGMRQKRTGAKGHDWVIEVPFGTEVQVLAQNQTARRRLPIESFHQTPGESRELILARPLKRRQVKRLIYTLEVEGQPISPRPLDTHLDRLNQPLVVAKLIADQQEVVIAQGGFGGRGNVAFKAPHRTTPLMAEYGSFGEIREIELELKLLADIGLVGLPSVGKSTLISALTQARPKVAAYPFTTLEPQLGILDHKGKELVIADLPGLIEGAHQGKGLGDRFLKHIQHTRKLVFVLALADTLALDQTVDDQVKVESLLTQFRTLETELARYDPDLLAKPSLVVVNKLDLHPQVPWPQQVGKALKRLVLPISAKTGQGVDRLKDWLITA